MSSEQQPGPRVFVCVWIALLALLGLTVGLSFLRLGVLSLVVAVAIAAVKSGLIGAYFMHARYDSGLVALFAIAGVYWVTILIGLVSLDYLSRF